MFNTKQCRICSAVKDIQNFYFCEGYVRSECKECTKKKVKAYQKQVKAWRSEARKKYHRKYYKMNPEKMARYRRDFRDRHPGYYKRFKKQTVEGQEKRAPTPRP
jgi:hypothetical protein